MANKCLSEFCVLSPLGYVVDAPVPPVAPDLRAGRFLLTRKLRVPLGSRRPGLEGRTIAKAFPKGTIRRGDAIVRLDTGDVYAWLKRDRAALTHLGLLPEILGHPDLDEARPVQITSADPKIAARLLVRIADISAAAARAVVTQGKPVALPRSAATALMVLAVDACGRHLCGDQSDTRTTAAILALAPIS